MDTSSLIEFVVCSELEKFILSHELLKPGDKLKGKIIEIKKNGKALINFEKFRAVAEINFPIKVGENLSVTVISKDPQLKLRLNNPQLDVSSEARNFISKIDVLPEKVLSKIQTEIQKMMDSNSAAEALKLPLAIKDALTMINAYFEPLHTGKNLKKLVNQLKNHICKSGIFFEKELEIAINKLNRTPGKIPDARELARFPEIKEEVLSADLKPNLLLLRDYLNRQAVLRKAGNPEQFKILRRIVDDLLNNINIQQNSAVEKQAYRQSTQEYLQVFHFTLPLKESEKNVRLKVYYSKKEKIKGKKGYKLSLLLMMNRLGDIRTDFFLMEKKLNVTFFVKNYEIKKKIDSNVREIKKTLEDSFDYLVLKVIVSDKKIKEFDTEDLEIVSSRMVDLKV